MKIIEFENHKKCENNVQPDAIKELLNDVFGTKEKNIKYGSDDWKDYLNHEIDCLDQTIEKIENCLLEIDMPNEQYSKISNLVDELTDFSTDITVALMLGFEEY